MLNLPKNIYVVAAMSALCFSTTSMMVFIGGLIGSQLAPVEHLATMPMAFMIIGLAASTIPAAMIMQKLGRKKGMQLGIVVAILACLVGFYALYHANFYLFLVASFAFGFNTAFVQQSRFVILENAETEAQQADGLTLALLANLLAAFLGPQMGGWGNDLIAGHENFSGSFLLLGMVLSLALILLSLFYTEQDIEIESKATNQNYTSILTLIKHPIFIVAAGSAAISYAVMSLVMTATPISMHDMDGHTLHHTKWVIQSHIAAMYLPSLFTGQLLKRGFSKSLIFTGLTAYIVVSFIAFAGAEVMHYWLALVVLGIGWNFMFMTSTAMLPSSYEPKDRYKAQALNDFSVFSIQAIATFSAGWILFSLGWNGILSIAIAISLIWGLAVLLLLSAHASSAKP